VRSTSMRDTPMRWPPMRDTSMGWSIGDARLSSSHDALLGCGGGFD